MKNPTPRYIARLIASIISATLLIVLGLVRLFISDEIGWIIVFGVPVIIFILSFFISAYAIEFFIYRKIKLIYKTIYDTKAYHPEKSSKPKIGGDILSEVGSEVDQWAVATRKDKKKSRKLESFRKEFLSNVYHELKTPVFNIQGYIETLLEGGLDDKGVNMKFLEKANRNVARIISIVNDMQLISNLEEGSFKLTEEKFDITEFAGEVFDSLDIMATKHKMTFEIKEGCRQSFMVQADRTMIRQVLNNLLINAIKYGKAKGRIQIGIYDMSENILVEITDEGIGIEKSHLPRIFERFYRVDKDRSREQGGSGLGLAIVKHIIERHGMAVNVRSTPGVGSTFGFTLPKA